MPLMARSVVEAGVGMTSNRLRMEAESPAVSVKRSVMPMSEVTASALGSKPKDARALPTPPVGAVTEKGSSWSVCTVAPSMSAE